MDEKEKQPHSHYCTNCHKLLLKSDFIDAEIVCHRCKTLNCIKFYKASKVLHKRFTTDTLKA